MTIKEYRLQNNITLEELSKITGISIRTIIRYEKDEQYGDRIKREYILSKMIENYEVTEEKGILSLENICNSLKKVFDNYVDSIDYCYLFGSYAKGYALDNSDVDLLVSTSLTGFDYVELIQKIKDSLHKKIDLIRMSDLKENFVLIEEIMKEGIKIYG